VGVMDTTPLPPRSAEEIRKQAKDYREMEDAVAQFGRLIELIEAPPIPFSEGDRIPYDIRFPQGEKTDESVELSDPPKLQ
jgi:hypothetical protein